MEHLKVNEIFNSISGEVSPFYQGVSTTFLRLSGCNLNCSYCDTDHDPFESLTVDEVVKRIYPLYRVSRNLCITGGEPLLQQKLLGEIIKQFPKCWIETNGTVEPEFKKPIPCCLVVDYKVDFWDGAVPQWYKELDSRHFIKFVVKNPDELEKCIEVQKILEKESPLHLFAYSPVVGEFGKGCSSGAKYIVSRLQSEKLSAILNVQIHKLIGMK